MTGRPHPPRMRAPAAPGLREGERMSGGDLPEEVVIGAPLPSRFGLRRFGGQVVGTGAPAEIWLAPSGPLPRGVHRLRTVRHRHLQQVLGILPLPSGQEAAVLEAPPGRQWAPGKGPPTLVLAVLEPVARALDALHAAGLCHLQLRPEHIQLVEDERGVVLCGLGRVQREAEAGAQGSTGSRIEGEGWEAGDPQPGALLLQCAYLAPEQVLPERAGLIHRRTDVYALAAVSFHALCGTPPFGPDGDPATLEAHALPARARAAAGLHKGDLGEAADAVLLRGLAHDPHDRPPSCSEFLDDLRAALAAQAPQPAEAGPTALQQSCVLVVAGSGAARRELQGLITAVSPRHPVLADAGAHAQSLALRYRPVLLLLHHPSLPEDMVLPLCRALGQEPALSRTHIVVLLQNLQGAVAQELQQLGVTIATGPASSASSWQNLPNPLSAAGARNLDSKPLVQLLRQVLSPGAARGPGRR